MRVGLVLAAAVFLSGCGADGMPTQPPSREERAAARLEAEQLAAEQVAAGEGVENPT